MMDRERVVIVSGLPRSGTSLMMKMLESGGMEVLIDEIREADIDNPKGYYEFERVKKLPEDTEWLDDAKGRVVKVLAELIKHLPDENQYMIVFMMRDLDEIIRSQKKMIVRRGEDPDKVTDSEMKALLRRYLISLKQYVNGKDNMDVLYVSYNELMDDPEDPVEEVMDFFKGELDEDAMLNCIDGTLYRNRK